MASKSLVLIFIFLSSLLYAGPTGLLNGTAARVGKSLITVEEAYVYRALQRFRTIEDFKKMKFSLIQREMGEVLKKTVQKLIFEQMVFSEMQSFKLDTLKRDEAQRLVAKQKAKGGRKHWREILKHYKKTEKEAIGRLHRMLQVERFIQKKVETLTPIITQAEVERYLKQYESRFKKSDREKIQPNVVLLLKKERVEKGIEEWVRFLKNKYGVTNYLEG